MSSHSLRHLLLLSTVLYGAPTLAAAQAAPAPQGEVQEVVVTGSRIRQPNLQSTSPLQSVDEQTVARSGATMLSEVINELPQLGAANGVASQSLDTANGNFSSGVELVNLRNLGAKRTLVLVNGRRYVGGDPGTSSVDMSSIPTDLISRVDVVTGAASAVYGADAVSGVVNVVLRDSYQGLRVSGRLGQSSKGDGTEQYLSALAGTSFDSGRGQVMFDAEYSNGDGVMFHNRDFGQYDAGNFTVSPANGSSANDGGRVTAGGVNYIFDANNRPVLASTVPTANYLYQRLPHRTLVAPIERMTGSLVTKYDLVQSNDGFSARGYVEAGYSHVKTSIQFEPMSLFFDGTKVGTLAEGPNDAPRIPANNPFLVQLANQIGVAPGSITVLNRRLSETGDRISQTSRDTARIAFGVEGQLNSNWRYDAYYQYGRVTSVQKDTGTIDRNRLFAALNVNDNGTPTNFSDDTCADPAYRALGCVPVNLFGAGTVSPQFLQYAGIPSRSKTLSKQAVASGYVSGDLFQLPAGPATIVLGAEYRKEEAVVAPASSYLDKSSSLRFLNGASGGYDVTEEFTELSLPILADAPFAKSFTIGLAARHSDYSSVGSKYAYSARADWGINDLLRLRAVYSTAVRAPNVNELFSPLSSSNGTVVDPCDRVADNGAAIALTGNRTTSCTAALGALAPALDQTQSQRQTVQIQSAGDQNLDAEKAKTYTVGMVLTPRTLLPGASLSVDYYNIKIDNVISSLGVQDIVNQCYDQSGLPANFCSRVTRSATTGQLFAVSNQLFNAASESVRGVDVQADYRRDLEDLGLTAPGRVELSVAWSRLLKHDFLSRPGGTVDKRLGQVGDFKNRVNTTLGYTLDKWRFAVTERYLSSVLADTTILPSNPLWPLNHFKARYYTDLQLNYMGEGGFEGTLGVRNVGNVQPPVNTTPSRTALGTTSVNGDIYDVVGRFFYVSLTKSF
jgi:iron complex outermembrane receptor protein